jgi:hypothetical protein
MRGEAACRCGRRCEVVAVVERPERKAWPEMANAQIRERKVRECGRIGSWNRMWIEKSKYVYLIFQKIKIF